MSDTHPEVQPSEDRQLSQDQLASADPEALAGTKEDIKTGVIDFLGEKFHVAEKTGALPMLLWANAAEAETEGTEGMAAIYMMLEDVIYETEFKRFVRHGLKNKADAEQLLDAISRAMEVITANPTEPQDGTATS